MSHFLNLITEETQKILNSKGLGEAKITAATNFLTDLQMDSLDLATLIINLEDLTQLEPFRNGFKSFHTVAQLAALYDTMSS